MNSTEEEQPEVSFRVPKPIPPEASGDDQAESEAAAYAFGFDLESKETETKFRRLVRKDAVNGTAAFVLQSFMLTGAFVVIVSFLVLFWHYIAPENLIYLDADRVARLKELLLSGAIGAALTAIGKSSLFSDHE